MITFTTGEWFDSKGQKVKNWKAKDYYLGKNTILAQQEITLKAVNQMLSRTG